MEEIYQRFRFGARLLDSECKILLTAIENATPWLETSPDFALCLRQSRRDKYTLESYIREREREGKKKVR